VKPTGNKNGHWIEYSETPPGCTEGFFWQRYDGVRFGFRTAGSYYRHGEVPSNRTPQQPMRRIGWGQADWDGARALPFYPHDHDLKETLPDHVRIISGGKPELLTEIEGCSVGVIARGPAQRIFDFIDKRYPIRDAVGERFTAGAQHPHEETR
jgi:hypothetical protein